jgi:dynamin GTPase
MSDEEEAPSKSSKNKKANGPDSGKAPSLVFKITSKVPYKTLLKGSGISIFRLPLCAVCRIFSFISLWLSCAMCANIFFNMYFAAESAVVLKAENMADKVEWLNKLRNLVGPSKAGEVKGESGLPIHQSFSDGYLVSYSTKLITYACSIS